MKNLIVAHRGARVEAPENTAAAFDAALSYPVDGIELDVQLSRDGQLVLYHDLTLQKINRSSLHIGDLSLADLEEIDWGSWFAQSFSGVRIMRFADLLVHYATRTKLFVEIKSFPGDRRSGRALLIAEKVRAAIDQFVPTGRQQNIFILSFDPAVLHYFHTQASGLQLILNVEKTATLLPEFICGVGVPIAELSRKFSDFNHGQGRKIMTWSCNTLAQTRKAFKLQVDLVLTDDPGWLTDVVDGRDNK